jgi:hypothetical protein
MIASDLCRKIPFLAFRGAFLAAGLYLASISSVNAQSGVLSDSGRGETVEFINWKIRLAIPEANLVVADDCTGVGQLLSRIRRSCETTGSI